MIEDKQPDRSHQTAIALINSLTKLPPDTLVVLSSDAEGNDFNLLDGFDPDARWDEATGDLDYSHGEDGQPRCVILFPEHR